MFSRLNTQRDQNLAWLVSIKYLGGYVSLYEISLHGFSIFWETFDLTLLIENQWATNNTTLEPPSVNTRKSGP